MSNLSFKTAVACALALLGVMLSSPPAWAASTTPQAAQAAPHIVEADVVYPMYNDIVIDEARGRIYASNNQANRIDILALETLQVVATLNLNSTVRGMDLDPSGKELAVAATGIGEIVFINPDTLAVTARLKLSTGSYELPHPVEVIYGRPGRLYATGWQPSSGVYVIDTTLKVEITHYVTYLDGEISMALSSDQNTLFVGTSGQSADIVRYDVSSDDIVSVAETPFNQVSGNMCLSQDQLIVTSQGQVWTSDLTTLLTDFFQPYYYGSIACSQTSALVFITYQSPIDDGSMLVIYDLDTYQEVGRRDFGVQLGAISLNDAESQMYISSGRGIETLGAAFRARAFFPVSRRTTAGIYGSLVYSLYYEISNQYLELRFYDGAAWSLLAVTATNSLGEFKFENVPGLQDGQGYVVLFRNAGGDESAVAVWASPVITSYAYGAKVILNPFDLREPELRSPPYYQQAEFPVTFSWMPRENSPADAYEVHISGPDWEPPFYTAPQVVSDHFVLTALPVGFKPHTGYIWELWVYAPDGGFGVSSKSTYFSFMPPPRPEQPLPSLPGSDVDPAIEAMLGR